MACDMSEPCKFPSLDSFQKRFLWTHKEVDLAPHPAVGLVIEVGDTGKFPHALGFESLFSVAELHQSNTWERFCNSCKMRERETTTTTTTTTERHGVLGLPRPVVVGITYK